MVHKELYSILITAVYSVQLKGEVDVVPHVVVTVHMVFKALDIVRMYCRSAKSIAERSGSGRCAKMYTGCNFQDFQCLDAYSAISRGKVHKCTYYHYVACKWKKHILIYLLQCIEFEG